MYIPGPCSTSFIPMRPFLIHIQNPRRIQPFRRRTINRTVTGIPRRHLKSTRIHCRFNSRGGHTTYTNPVASHWRHGFALVHITVILYGAVVVLTVSITRNQLLEFGRLTSWFHRGKTTIKSCFCLRLEVMLWQVTVDSCHCNITSNVNAKRVFITQRRKLRC